MNSLNHCHVTSQVNAHTTAWDMPEITSDELTTEIVAELLTHGCVTINREEYHVMDLYQYADEEDLNNLVYMTICDPAAAKDHATQIITDCAIRYFGEINPGLAVQYYQENNGEY